MMSEVWPMLEWSPATMPLIISMHLSTQAWLPTIWMGIMPPQEPWPVLSIMWHFFTPLICRTVSMVWPRRPSRWPFLLVGTSMTRSSMPPGSTAAGSADALEAPAAAASAARTEAVEFAATELCCEAETGWMVAVLAEPALPPPPPLLLCACAAGGTGWQDPGTNSGASTDKPVLLPLGTNGRASAQRPALSASSAHETRSRDALALLRIPG
mmetsp:Transcript_47971/g.133302  ORF Transcript_47971/g.133302 Transcript_47971/m.133302 type:complete len:212 (+) Transcript_47971:462-1097(+)